MQIWRPFLMELDVLLTLGFKKVYEKASNWLRDIQWSSLFLDLPNELDPFIKSYFKGKINEEKLWENCATLTGLEEPFIKSLKLRYQSVLNSIKEIRTNDRRINCYRDLESYIKQSKIIEKILLLELRHRIGRKLEITEWTNVLFEEKKISEKSWYQATENIIEEADENTRNIILYEGSLESVKHLKKGSNKVKIILLENYWKSPLDMLRTILWKYGFDHISDEKIIHYLNLQQKYLELIIYSKDVDEAHQIWTDKIQRI
jgi:hypothetical protein